MREASAVTRLTGYLTGGALGSLGLVAASLVVAAAMTVVSAQHVSGPQQRLDIQVATAADRGWGENTSIPPKPDDVTAAKAYAVLDQTCAQCHQAGRLKAPIAAGRLGNILALDEIAATPSLVRPGLPDASRIYDVLVRRHAPLSLPSLLQAPLAKDKEQASKDGTGKDQAAKDQPAKDQSIRDQAGKDAAQRPWPSSTEIQSVRDWIERLPRNAGGARCDDRPKVTADELATEIARIVTDTPSALQPGLRFISLASLHNACVSDAELESYRQAITVLINGLSWAERPQTIRSQGPGRVLLAFNLRDVLWVPAHWQRLVALYPYAPALDATLDEAVFKLVETRVPVLRADWFAYAAGSAPLYYDLIGMPNSMRDLELILNVNSSNLVLRGAAVRAGVEHSQITGGPRMIERLPARTGSLWRSYDLDGRRAGESVLATPIGPEPVGAIDRVFKPAGARILFAAPNGFTMFGQFDAAGDRTSGRRDEADRGLADINSSHREGVALSCATCHMRGPLGVRDEVRALASKDTTAKPVRDAIIMLHPEQSSIDALVTEDRDRVSRAFADAGVDADRRVRGLSPLAALLARYEAGGDLDTIAAESGKTRDEVWRSVKSSTEEVREIVLRAHNGPVGRSEMNRVSMALGGAAAVAQADDGAAKPETTAVPTQSAKPQSIDLTLWQNSPEFRVGDIAAFVVRASSDCHLTLVGIDNRGIATVLFPNDFEQDNRLTAGKALKIPSDAAAYQFRLKEVGNEVVVGMCTANARTFAGIEHDFERQRFTVLGNWSVFIADQLSLVEKQEAELPAPTPAKARPKSKDRAADKPELPSIASNYGHAAIGYEIKP